MANQTLLSFTADVKYITFLFAMERTVIRDALERRAEICRYSLVSESFRHVD